MFSLHVYGHYVICVHLCSTCGVFSASGWHNEGVIFYWPEESKSIN